MKPLFYYFGVARAGKLFSIADVIRISKGGTVFSVDNMDASFVDKELKIDSFFEIYRFERGLLFGVSEGKKLEDFLSSGEMLSPKIRKGNLSVFFMDKEKIALFKLNQRMESWKQAKGFVWKSIKPLGLISLNDFRKETKDMIDDQYSCECHTQGFKLGGLSTSICNSDKLYFSLRTKDYSKLKKKIYSIYKGGPLSTAISVRHK